MKKVFYKGLCLVLLLTMIIGQSLPISALENTDVDTREFDLNQGLIAYLDMEDNYNDKINSQMPTFKGDGKVEYETGVKGKALRFSDDATEATRLEFTNREDLQFGENDSFTIGAWVKVNGIDGDPIDPTIFGTKDWNLGHNNGFALVIRDNYFNFNTKSVAKQTRYDNKFYTNFEDQWQFVVVSQDKNGVSSIYVNGEKGSDILETNVGTNNVASGTFSIGGTFKGNYGFKNQVAIDEFKVWNRVLSEEEIQYLYKNTATIDISGPEEIDLSSNQTIEVVYKLASAGGVDGNVSWTCDNSDVEIKKVNATTINVVFPNTLSEQFIVLKAQRGNEEYEKVIKIVRDTKIVRTKLSGDSIIVKDGPMVVDFSLGLYNGKNVPINIDDKIEWSMDQEIKGIDIVGSSQNIQLHVDETVVTPCTFVLKAKYLDFEEEMKIQVIKKGELPVEIMNKADYFFPFENDLNDVNQHNVIQNGENISITNDGVLSNGATFTKGSYLDLGLVDLSNKSIAFSVRSNYFTGVQDPCIMANKNWDPWAGSGFTFAYSMNSKNTYKNRLAYKSSGGKDLFVSHEDGKWNDIVLSFDTAHDMYRLYVDGKLQDEIETQNFVENWQNGGFDGSTLKVGNDGTGKYPANSNANSDYSFTLDNLLITTTLLNEDEVALLHEMNKTEQAINIDLVASDSIASNSIYTADLHVTQEQADDIIALTFDIIYDSDIMELMNYQNYMGGLKLVTDNYKNKINVSFTKNGGMPTGNIINYIKTRIAKLQFKVKDIDANIDSFIKIDNIKAYKSKDYTNQEYEYSLNGTDQAFTVYSNKIFDFNQDGVIGVGDVSLAPDNLKEQVAKEAKIYPYKRVVSVTMDGGGISWDPENAYYFQDIIGNAKGLDNVRTNTYAMDLHNNEFATSYSAITVNPPISGHNYIAMLTGQNWPELPSEYQYVNDTATKYYWADFKKEEPLYPTVFKAIKDQDPSRALAMFTEWRAIEEGLIEPDAGVFTTNNDKSIVFDKASSFINQNPEIFKKTAYTFMQSDVMDLHGHANGYFIDSYYETLKNYDGWWEELITALKDNDFYDDTLIISNADHGGSVYSDGKGGYYGNHIVYDWPQDHTIYFSVGGQTVNKGMKLEGGRNTDLAGIVLEGLRMEKPASMNQTGVFDERMFLSQEELKQNNRDIEHVKFSRTLNKNEANISLENVSHTIKSVDLVIEMDNNKAVDIKSEGKILRNEIKDGKLYLTISYTQTPESLAQLSFENNVSDNLKVEEVMLGTDTGKEIYCDLTNESQVVVDDVNKTALTIAVDMANKVTEEQLEQVVPAVVNEFKAALANGQTVLTDPAASQETVDVAFARLSVAMHMLEFIKGDKDELETLINSTNELVEGNYTPESWQTLTDALEAANAVMNDENAMQNEVDEAYDNLQAAIDGLEDTKVVDKTFLEAMVNKVLGLEGNKYIPSTWDAMLPVLQVAQDVLADEGATQEEVDASLEALTRAYLDLRLIPDKDLLSELINKAKGLNEASYTPESWSVVIKALDEAKAALANENVDEIMVNNVAAKLQIALDGLERKPDSIVEVGDKIFGVDTGDNNLISIFITGMMLSAGALALLKKKE